MALITLFLTVICFVGSVFSFSQIPSCPQIPNVLNGDLVVAAGECINCEPGKPNFFKQTDETQSFLDPDDLVAKPISMFSPGTVLHLKCDFGHEPATKHGSEFTVCNINGTWYPPLARCKRETICNLPPTPANGEIIRWSDGFSATFKPGEVIEYACSHNYELRGSRTIACTQDGKWSDTPPECVSGSQVYQTSYWSSLKSRPAKTSQLCPDSIHGLLTDPDSQHQAIVICFSGIIKSVKSDCETVVWSGKVIPPSGQESGIWYSAFDRVKRRFYFTMSARAGIYTVSFDAVKVHSFFNESVEMELFVRGDGQKSFYGLAVDEKRRLLYCTDPVKGTFGIWSLENSNYRKFFRAPNGIQKFQPAFIALSPLPIPSDEDEERLMAISDWNNDQIYVYRQSGKFNPEKLLNISHYYLGTIVTAIRPRSADNNDPRGLMIAGDGGNATRIYLAKGEARLGSVDGPLGLYFDAAHNLLVADYLNHRVQIFDGGRDDKVVSEPLFRPGWASANLNAWVLVVQTLIDNANAGTSRSRLDPVVMAGLGTGELACFRS